ncbi:MAG: hypothetical protein LWW86_01385 [Micrococcales bacterium]|nr:hypothetical protein [Micrococcales bacterium]
MSPTPRRHVNFSRWIATGAILGFAIGGIVSMRGPRTTTYSANAELGFMGIAFALFGGLIAAIIAVLVAGRAGRS